MTTHSTSVSELNDIESFEDRYSYDATYLKEMLRSAPEAYQVFSGFLPMAQFRLDAEPDIYFTARITAFLEVDCGPCLQLAIRKAQEAGLSEELIRKILQADEPMSPLLETVRRFAHALLAGAPECDQLREDLLNQLGESTVVEVAFGVASAQVFPVIKRAMGHYRSCSATPLQIESDCDAET